MTEEGWRDQKPAQPGLYHMRKVGENEGRTIEVVPPDKYKTSEAGDLLDLPEAGYEYRLRDAGYGSSA